MNIHSGVGRDRLSRCRVSLLEVETVFLDVWTSELDAVVDAYGLISSLCAACVLLERGALLDLVLRI